MEKRMLTPAEVCEATVNVGIAKTSLSSLQMLLLGIFAGAFIAFGGFSSTMASHSIENAGLAKLVTGSVFPVGLMLVVICGAELFTGNNLISVALFDKKVTANKMFKNWAIVYVGNFIGSILIAYLVFESGLFGLNAGKVGAAAIKTAVYKGGLTFGNGIASGILCNMLVCLAVWASFAAKDIAGKVAIIWFPIMAFVASGFEHSIANMYYFAAGIFAKSNEVYAAASGLTADKLAGLNWGTAFINNIIPVTIGNVIGGVVVVSLVYWIIYKYAPSIKASKEKAVSK